MRFINLSIYHILVTHQRHISHLFCPVGTAFGKAGFGKEVVVDILIGEQLAALYKGFQNAEVNFLIRPFALAEKGGVFVLFGENIDFSLTLFFRVVAPPASERGKLHRALAGEQQLPEILLADFLKHLAHIVGQMRLDALVGQVGSATGDDRIVFRHKTIPEAEHIVRN